MPAAAKPAILRGLAVNGCYSSRQIKRYQMHRGRQRVNGQNKSGITVLLLCRFYNLVL